MSNDDDLPYYGSFLVKGNRYHDEYFDKFKRRVNALNALSEITRARIAGSYPELSNIISVSYPNVVSVNIRYFNDLIRLKTFHPIKPAHKSKIAGYTLKWINLYPPIVSTATPDEFSSLSEEARSVVLALKPSIASPLIAYLYKGRVDFTEEKMASLIKDVIYFMETDSYEPHCVAAFFNAV